MITFNKAVGKMLGGFVFANPMFIAKIEQAYFPFMFGAKLEQHLL